MNEKRGGGFQGGPQDRVKLAIKGHAARTQGAIGVRIGVIGDPAAESEA